MPMYSYKVRDKAATIHNGQMEAADERDLRRKLDEMEYFIIDYSRLTSEKVFLFKSISFGLGHASYTDLALISWQLFTLLNAGLTLSNSLTIIINQTKNEVLKTALSRVYSRVEAGSTFSDALKESPKVFSRFYVQMVNAGEVGGVLDEMLKRLAIYYERQAEISSKIKSAMIYPALLLTVSCGVIMFLVMFVLPQFSSIFKEIGVSLPVPTLMLLSFSAMLRTYWLMFIAAAFGIYSLGWVLVNTDQGGYQFDLLKLKLPVVGGLINKSVTVQFTQTLSTLVSAGIPILSALDVVTDTIGNKAIIKVLKKVSSFVEQGKPIAQPLDESRMFPDMLINMIRVGEETGSLSNMLDKIGEFYYKDVNNAVEYFTKMIEPTLMVIMAGIIGFITTSIFLPLSSLLQTIR